MELKIKWLYKERFSQFFKRIFLYFPFISTSPFLHSRNSLVSLWHYIALASCNILK